MTTAQYTDAGHTSVRAEIDGVSSVFPASETNRHFRKLVAAGVPITAYSDPPTGDKVNAERDRRINAGFFVDFGGGVVKPFDSDQAAQKRIAAVHSFALAAIVGGAQPSDLRWANPDADFAWICADNTSQPMDAHTAREFAEAAMGYESALVTTARIMKDSGAIPGDYANDQYWPSSTLTLG